MMIPLVMTPQISSRIREIVAYAIKQENRRFDATKIGGANVIGDEGDPYTIIIPMGFKVVFSIDGDGKGNWYRHMSVSLPSTGGTRVPHILAMQMIAKEYGFTDDAQMSPSPYDHPWVIHVIESFAD